MKRIFRMMFCLCVAVLLTASAQAGINYEVGVLWQPRGDDDVQVYLHASNVAYPAPRDHVESIFVDIPHPERDYPVLAFIAYHSHADIRAVWSYRLKGHSWFDVMVRFGVRPDVLFVKLKKHPRPPYGKAYGHWRKHPHKIKAKDVSDGDVRFWVGVRTVSAYAGISPDRAYERHAGGEKLSNIAGKHYRAKKAAHSKSQHKHKTSHKGKGKKGRR